MSKMSSECMNGFLQRIISEIEGVHDEMRLRHRTSMQVRAWHGSQKCRPKNRGDVGHTRDSA